MSEKLKCGWCAGDELYEKYHDTEWGVPVYNDKELFEFLTLETFQAGLSWITILRKRKNFRKAFDDFNYKKISTYSEDKIQELLQDEGIVRNKLKVRATVNNAQKFLEVQKEFGSFSKYIWAFVDHSPIQNSVEHYKQAPATSEISDALSKDLKKKGFKFVGSTVIYAHMQATGMVNDHQKDCFRYLEVKNNIH